MSVEPSLRGRSSEDPATADSPAGSTVGPGNATVGIVANPAAGKDIRRLVSAASPVSDMAKIGIIRRAAIGAVEGGAIRLVLADDRHALARRALKGIDELRTADGEPVVVEVLDLPLLSTSRDSQRAAAAMAERQVGSLIVLGGDGTHRDVAKGWRRAPMVAISTGTNNVFPAAVEATVAGHAAGMVSSGAVPVHEVADDAAVIEVELRTADGVDHDLSLVDLALTNETFTGSRAIWDTASLRELVTVIAEPDSVGLSAIAAAVAPSLRSERTGVHLRFSCGADAATEPQRVVRCAIAPGRYADVAVAASRRFGPDDEVVLHGPGVLSFDGERDVVLDPGDRAAVRIAADGPRVIDVARTMARRSLPPAHDPQHDPIRRDAAQHDLRSD